MSTKRTPILEKYQDIKDEHPEAVVFLLLGDFYETFFDDASYLASLLELTLTQYQKAPMVGIPRWGFKRTLDKLTELGVQVVVDEDSE